MDTIPTLIIVSDICFDIYKNIDRRFDMNQQEKNEYFETIYRSTFNPLSKYVYFKVRTLADAEDIVQSVYTQFYQYTVLKGIQPEYILAYLIKIANSLLSEYYRRKAQFSLYDDIDENYIEQVADESNLDENLFDDFDYEQIWAMVQKLNETEQKILTGLYRYDMTFKEIAEVFSLNENSIKSVYYRSLKKLKTFLENETI